MKKAAFAAFFVSLWRQKGKFGSVRQARDLVGRMTVKFRVNDDNNKVLYAFYWIGDVTCRAVDEPGHGRRAGQ